MKFRYVRYRCDPSPASQKNHVYLPHIPIKVAHGNDITPEIFAVVDSGADMTTFHNSVAEFFGVKPQDGVLNVVRGLGGEHDTYIHDGFQLEAGGFRIPMRVAFSQDAPENLGLLGREGFFEYFKVTIDEVKKVIELKRQQT